MLSFETSFWRRHPSGVLVGIDEAGRGPLAGPVVACALVMPQDIAIHAMWDGLTDSKQLTEAQRETFCALLEGTAGVSIGLGWVGAEEIDAVNILQATYRAMAKAVAALSPLRPDHALVDGNPVTGLPCPFTAIVKGDAQSLLIAAASVVAKVHRDRYMRTLATRYPDYGFAEHKGYGTAEHLAALSRLGPCPEHRKTFRPVAETMQGRLF